MNDILVLRAQFFLGQFPAPSLDTINALLRRHAGHLWSLQLCLTEDSFVRLHSGTSFPILEIYRSVATMTSALEPAKILSAELLGFDHFFSMV
jgi:hypothetical protein